MSASSWKLVSPYGKRKATVALRVEKRGGELESNESNESREIDVIDRQ